MPLNSRTLELYFIDGRPDGLLTAQVFNWTGHLLVAPRTRIAEALKRKESSFTGVYVLLGESEGQLNVYVGEGEDISTRIARHDIEKDWWSLAVFITSAANDLHKAHVQYLESKLVERARSIGKANVTNANNPRTPSLSEAAISNMEAFLAQLYMILPAVRVDVFEEKTRTTPEELSVSPIDQPTFEGFVKKEDIKAVAELRDGEFVVKANSLARLDWIGDRSDKTSYWKLFDELVRTGVLIKDGSNRRFSKSYAFSSPSAAGAVVTGRTTAGPIFWRLQTTGQTYKEWEADQLAD